MWEMRTGGTLTMLTAQVMKFMGGSFESDLKGQLASESSAEPLFLCPSLLHSLSLTPCLLASALRRWDFL